MVINYVLYGQLYINSLIAIKSTKASLQDSTEPIKIKSSIAFIRSNRFKGEKIILKKLAAKLNRLHGCFSLN